MNSWCLIRREIRHRPCSLSSLSHADCSSAQIEGLADLHDLYEDCLLLGNFLLKFFLDNGEFQQIPCRCRKHGPTMQRFHGPCSVPSVRQGGGGVRLPRPLFPFLLARGALVAALSRVSPLQPWALFVPGMSPSSPYERGGFAMRFFYRQANPRGRQSMSGPIMAAARTHHCI